MTTLHVETPGGCPWEVSDDLTADVTLQRLGQTSVHLTLKADEGTTIDTLATMDPDACTIEASAQIGFGGTAHIKWTITPGEGFSGTIDQSICDAVGTVEGTYLGSVPEPKKYRKVSLGSRHRCTIDLDDTLECSSNLVGITIEPTPGAKYRDVACGWQATCALTEAGEIECVDMLLPEGTEFPAGPFEKISRRCALDASGSVKCWGGVSSPGGTFNDVGTSSISGDIACGIRSDSGALVCWGEMGGAAPFASTYTSIDVGSDGGVCAVRKDGGAECRLYGSQALNLPSSTDFKQISVGVDQVCGLLVDGTVRCWYVTEEAYDAPSPAEKFVQIDAAEIGGCGITTSGYLLCW